jgi:hypothetical protein
MYKERGAHLVGRLEALGIVEVDRAYLQVDKEIFVARFRRTFGGWKQGRSLSVLPSFLPSVEVCHLSHGIRLALLCLLHSMGKPFLRSIIWRYFLACR